MRRISWNYWIHHKRRVFSIIGAIAIAVASIMCCCFLVRGMALSKYENYLNNYGAYNVMIKAVNEQQIEAIEDSSKVSSIGRLVIYGAAEAKNGTGMLAGYMDEKAQMLYHQSCEKGIYPVKENELVATRKTLEAMGIYPEVGETVELTLSGADGTSEQKEYVVSGILKSLQQERYLLDDSEFVFPSIFIGEQSNQQGQTQVFLEEQKGTPLQELADWLQAGKYDYAITYGKLMAQSMVVPNAIEISQESIDAAIPYEQKDFDSAVLIPVFSVLVCAVAFIAVYVAVHTIFQERRQQLTLLRTLGLTKRRMYRMLIAEYGGLSLIGLIVGYMCGLLGYGLLLLIQQNILHQKIYSAYRVEQIVAAGTLSPYVYPIIICIEGIVLIGILSMLHIKDSSIFEELTDNLKKNQSLRRKKLVPMMSRIIGGERSYRFCYGMILVVLMSTAVFGSVYFLARADTETKDVQATIDKMNQSGSDYWADKDFDFSVCGYADLNRHNGGIAMSDISRLEQCKDVKQLQYAVEARSTKIVLDKEDTTGLSEKLSSLKVGKDEKDEQIQLFEKSAEILGYEDVNRYNIPTIGVSDSEIEEMQEYILEGSIDTEALRNGTEVLIVCREQNGECPYQPGDVIQMTDTVQTDEVIEEFSFNRGQILDGYEPSFEWSYQNEDGTFEDTKYPGYVFGEKVDYEVTVGGILYISDSNKRTFYQTDSLIGNCKFEFLCNKEAFSKWGLPDRNATKIRIQTEHTGKGQQLERLWYEIIGNSQDMKGESNLQLIEEVQSTKVTYMYAVNYGCFRYCKYDKSGNPFKTE